MVESIKDLKDLQQNISQYFNSPNENIQKEYDKIRIQISKIIQEIMLAIKEKEANINLEKLELLKEKAKAKDKMHDGTIDSLLKNKLITAEMATSLANDSKTTYSVVKHLIYAAELLYSKSDTLLDELAE